MEVMEVMEVNAERPRYLRAPTRSPDEMDRAREWLEAVAAEPVLTARMARQKTQLNPLAVAAATLRWARLQEADSELCGDWFVILDTARENANG